MAAQNGMFASFLPKPMLDCAGSGFHINMSLSKDGRNIFQNGGGQHCPEAEGFLAGILARVREITAILNPLTNSYRRFGAVETPPYNTFTQSNPKPRIRNTSRTSL